MAIFDAVALRPWRQRIPAENLLMLSAARQLSGQELETIEALQYAALRGWRLQPAQEAMLQLALINGNTPEAANRLAALWALDAKSPAQGKFTQVILSTEAGRHSFAVQLAGTQNWQDRSLTGGLEMVDPDTMAQTIHDASQLGAEFDCAALSRAARSLANSGNAAPAALMWSDQCAGKSDSGRLDIAFHPDRSEQAGPFDGIFPLKPRITQNVRQQGANWVMGYESREPVITALATRLARMLAGSHALSLSSQGGTGDLAAHVHCLDTTGNRRKIAGRIGEGDLAFSVPASGCPVQRIQLLARSGSRDGLSTVLK